ncbi:MAG: histone deacetylase, partial [Candidatus Magnetomorum sp.]|nr:histone deacetylase [Candidatus Magnetomorum sp.]
NSMTTDTRSRNIFYDTDSLLEVQEETLQVCNACSGALKIDSYTDRGGKILCIHIPRKACSECLNIGYEWFDRAHKKYDRVFLQNRQSDIYLTK